MAKITLWKRLSRAWREITDPNAGGEGTWKGAALNRLTHEWVASAVHPDQESRWSVRRLRARARELARNEGHPRQFLNLLKTNVVGPTGPKMQAQARRNGELDRETNSRIEAAWKAWSKSKVTVDRRLTWPAFQHLVLKTIATDGECFVRKFPGFPNDFGFALQIIDADQVDEQLNEERGPGRNEIRLGVEIDELGAPVAYWVNDYRPGISTLSVPKKRERVPAEQMLHLYLSDRANQTRGVTWFHAVMAKLKMLGGYTEAELVAARAGAAKMGFFQSRPGEVTAGESQENEPLEMDANPGTLERLPAGYEFAAWDPTHPVTAFPNFVKSMLHEIASGLGVSYTALSGDLEGVNYSSIRSGVLLERDVWRLLQWWWISELVAPVFSDWLNMALLTGALELESFDASRYQAVRWTPRGWTWVDPLKDAQAGVLSVSNGLMSRQRLLAEQGLDIEEIFEELKAEQELAEEMGIQLAPPASAQIVVETDDEDEAKPSENGKKDRRLDPRLIAASRR